MAYIYSPKELLEKKYTTETNFNQSVDKSQSFLKDCLYKNLIVSGSLFGAAARGDYKRGSDIDMMIITLNDTYSTVIEMLNTFSMEIRDILHIPLDLHVHTLSAITKGNTYYDPSFLSHLITDCPPSVKRGESLENIIPIDANWTAKEAMNARMRIAKLDLARLQAGLTYHKEKLDGYFLGGLQKLFSRVQHTTRNMLFITKALESYMEKNRTKKALLQLYLEIFKRDSVDKIGKQIIDVEDKYYNILEQTIQHIEEGNRNIKEYKGFLLTIDYVIPLAIKFFDINLDILNDH